MKHFFFASFIAVILLFSCKKENTPHEPQTPAPTFSATVDGQIWSPETISAEYRNGKVLLVAEGTDGRRMAFSAATASEITFDLSNPGFPVVIYDTGKGVPPYFSKYSTGDVGTLKITTLNLEDSLLSGEITTKTRQLQALNGDINLTVKFENLKLSGILPSSQKMQADLNPAADFSGFFTAAYIKQSSGAVEIAFIGIDAQSQVIVTVGKNIDTGNFILNSYLDGGVPSAIFFNKISPFYFDGTGGSLRITAHDKTARKIEGIFSFTGSNIATGETIDVSNGSFSVGY